MKSIATLILFTICSFSFAQTDFSLGINSGGPDINFEGTLFTADQYYTHGAIASNTNAALNGVYKTERWGSFSYVVPVANGDYTVTLYFAEFYFTTGTGRIFDVDIEGQKVLDNFAMNSEVPAYTPVTKTFTTTVIDGKVDIKIYSTPADGGVNNPKISGVKIVRNNPDTQAPSTPSLSSSSKTDTTVNLGWTAATDVSGVTNYKVFRNGTLLTTLGNVLNYQATGLSANTTYSFTVKAIDAVGNESPNSNSLTVTTDASSSTGGGTTSSIWVQENSNISYNNGNVGVGTTNPTEKLHVNGNILSNKLMLNDPIRTTDWNTVWQSGFYESIDAANAPETGVWFWGLNMNHVANNATYKYNGQIAIKNSSTNPVMYFRSTNRDGIGNWTKILNSSGTQIISGKLGIDTNSFGSHKLAVEGSIGAREIKVEASGWSDFVFYKDYKLPTLKEVAQHIKEKGHLKDIPSAKDVAENGIFLGEMDAKLLQKIEELTLYTLEQEEKIDQLQELESEVLELKRLLRELLAK